MAENYLEPIVLERADPWIYKHTDGYYYFTGSKPGYQEIELRDPFYSGKMVHLFCCCRSWRSQK